MTKGTVFDIKEFSIYDGFGMRATVFLKGCPLSCQWCHNPEGLSAKPQIMVNASSCLGCGKCRIEDCSFSITGSCDGCGRCVNKCPNNLRTVKGQVYTASELIEKLNGYSPFFGEDGGITFSGGEPTLQFDFLYEVVCGVNGKTAIETCGFCDEEKFKKLLDKLSFVFMDFKIFDEDKHKFFTGVSNALIKKNLEHLKNSNKPFIIRIPLIKGVNDDKENLENTAKLLENSKNLIRVEILPYNTLAPAKYEMVGKKFLNDFEKPTEINVDCFLDRKIDVKIL